jgi:CHAT domain-containing protein
LRLTPTSDDDDGRLTVDQIFDQELSAQMVVLAACDTGIGLGYQGAVNPLLGAKEQAFPPGDEVVGLSRAFLYAGTASVVASLWAVEDTSTATLMSHFYRNLRTMPKAEALRQAQLLLLQAKPDPGLDARAGSAVKPDLSHPYFWAPFVLIGDGHSVIRP